MNSKKHSENSEKAKMLTWHVFCIDFDDHML